MGKVARLSSFALLPVEEIGHWLASLYSVFGIYMSAWLSLSGPFQQSDNLFSSIHNLSSILHVLKCWLLCFFFFFSVCFFSAGLAHWYPTDPHTIIMAAGPRRSHPRLCPSVKCHRITCGNDSLRCCHAAGTQLAVGQPTTVKDACRLMGFSNLKLNHFQCYFFQVKLE